MELTIDTTQIYGNAISGTVAGVMVSLVLGFYQRYRAYWERCDQIGYLSVMVADATGMIVEARTDECRLLYYNRLLRSVEGYLNTYEASSKISFFEKQELRAVFPFRIDGRVAYLDAVPENAAAYFNAATERLKGISWLTLNR